MSDPGTFPQLCLGSDLPLLIPLAGGIMQKGFFLCTKTRSADFPSAGLFILGRHNQHFRRSHQYPKEVDQLPGLHQMADVWSKAKKTSHLRNGAVMSNALLYEMTLLDPSTFAIGAALSMSLVKH